MKYFNLKRLDLIIFAALIIAFWGMRLYNLTQIPMFTDESIYLRWSQVGLRDAAWRFIPLTDGKPPLWHWGVMGVMATGLFEDPLFEGRIVSVFSGFMSMIFIWLLAYEMFKNKRVAHLASLFYLLSPIMVVHDRLAVVDALLTTMSIASLWFAVLLVKYLRFDTALLFGMAFGAGLLTKASGLLFLLLSPATILLADWKRKDWIKKGATWIGYLLIAAILGQVIYSILRLSQFYYRIDQKNLEFIIPFSEFIKDPLRLFFGNAKSLFKWQIGYLTIPAALLLVTTAFNKDRWRQHLVLWAYVIPTFIAISSFNKIIFPRFLLFSFPFLLVLAASALDWLLEKAKDQKVQLIVAAVFLYLPLQNSLLWITIPEKSGIPNADKNQYYLGQPGGKGVREMVAFLEERAKENDVFLGTDGTFGLTPDAFLVAFIDNPKVRVEGYYPVSTIPEEVLEMSKEKETYFVYFNVQDIPVQENIELIQEHEKTSSDNTTYLRLYKVNPMEE